MNANVSAATSAEMIFFSFFFFCLSLIYLAAVKWNKAQEPGKSKGVFLNSLSWQECKSQRIVCALVSKRIICNSGKAG